MPTRRLIRNAARCLTCGETVESTKDLGGDWCKCSSLRVNGGLRYIGRSVYGPYEELSQFEEETAEGATKVAALADAMRRK